MRMFSCLYKDKKLELISRKPCVMSSPFLTGDLNMVPHGRISEPNDHDFILQHIFCRDNEDEDDPRCMEMQRQKVFSKIKGEYY
ncbi:hypothetical protein K1T71_015178 [Dendrolimus kikuchii]|nr:hypothetical protein K1T71_015178 [Dendrolimus kikuchii]